MMARKPAFLLRDVNAGPKMSLDDMGGGKTLCMLLRRLSLIEGIKLPKINPTIEMMAMMMGKKAVMRLNANPDAKFKIQSLLHFVQKACRDLMFFSTVCIGSDVWVDFVSTAWPFFISPAR